MAAVKEAVAMGLTDLTIYYDYMGIEMWATGAWKRNKQGTIAYYDFIQSVNDKISLHFVKVKGHSGVEGNEEADRCDKVSVFNVELKKVVDDSYDIEMGYRLEDQLVEDLETGLLGKIRKFAVITDSNVLDLYAKPISEKLSKAGFKVELFVFPAGEKSKTRQTKAKIEDAMLEKGFRRDCAVIAIGGGVVTDLAGFLAGTYGRGVPFINYATTLLERLPLIHRLQRI